MGKRSAAGELFLGNMGSIQRETRPSIQREDQLTMETKLEQIAAKCCEPPVEERSAVNPHATFCGSRRRATASDDPVGRANWQAVASMRTVEAPKWLPRAKRIAGIWECRAVDLSAKAMSTSLFWNGRCRSPRGR
jgi:hypothetical protein